MKIAIDCRMINSSGIGTFLRGILKYLFENNGLTFVLIGNNQELQEFKDLKNPDRIKIINFDAPIFSMRELFSFPVKEVNSCDLFFAPNYNIPNGIKVKIISTIHDVLFLDVPNLTGKVGYLIRRLFVFRALKISDQIITVSKFSKNRIQYHFPKFDKIIVGGNGLKDSIISYRNKVVTTRSKDYFLFIGNLKPHKGIDILLRAYKKYLGLGGKLKLKIVGEKDKFKTGISIPDSMDGKITFTGKINNEDLYSTIYNAFCLIQPSIYEGFGIPPLEAMALGTPVIISDIPVFKEIYESYPVTFFKSQNYSDLADKMLLEHFPVDLTNEQLNKHSYKSVAQFLMTIFYNYENSSRR